MERRRNESHVKNYSLLSYMYKLFRPVFKKNRMETLLDENQPENRLVSEKVTQPLVVLNNQSTDRNM